MQQAYRPALAVSPGQNLLQQQGHTAVMWSPERLNLRNKYVGVEEIQPRHFVLLRDQSYGERDQSESIFTADASAKRDVVVHVKTAHACALEILVQHGTRGAIQIDAFNDVPVAKIEAFEQKLIALGWFTVPLLTDLTGILDQVRPSDEIEQLAIRDLRAAIEATVAYRIAKMDDTLNEIQGRKNGHMGRSSMSRQELEYYAEIGIVVPDSAMSAPVSPAGETSAEAEERLDRKFEALVGAMTDAFNNKISAVVAEKIGVSNEKDNGNTNKEGEASKETASRTRRSPLAG